MEKGGDMGASLYRGVLLGDGAKKEAAGVDVGTPVYHLEFPLCIQLTIP
jgi:hypothetical protein